LSRAEKQQKDIQTFTWDLEKNEIQKEALETADYIVHLAGVSIGEQRWTRKRKQEIIDSRVKTGELIHRKIKEQNTELRAFISASAIGYYGTITSDKIFTETDLPASDFLGETCRQWEKMTDDFKDLEIRTVKIRTGVVLTKQGGALSKMATPLKLGLGSAIGSGKQYLPWIHIKDLCDIYIKAIEDSQIEGAYNAVAPDHKTNKEFIRTLARVLKRPLWFPNIPAIIMKLMFGKMSGILLEGSRISSAKLKEKGYTFLFPDLESALEDVYRK